MFIFRESKRWHLNVINNREIWLMLPSCGQEMLSDARRSYKKKKKRQTDTAQTHLCVAVPVWALYVNFPEVYNKRWLGWCRRVRPLQPPN